MGHKYIYTSLTRISDLAERGFAVQQLPKDKWEKGDYVVCNIPDPGNKALSLELPNGRMAGLIGKENMLGALGDRFATLEATDTWRKWVNNRKMNVLTGTGLMGKPTSKSSFIPNMMKVVYVGHALRNGKKLNMRLFVKTVKKVPFTTPVVPFVGTSISAGKTTSARTVTQLFKMEGYKVVGVKLTCAGRFKDILAIKDVGANTVLNLVDIGLPSSKYPKEKYQAYLKQLLSKIQQQNVDVAIIEIGASPLEPYNGDSAINTKREQVRCTVLAASDAYALYGLMNSFNLVPDAVTGIASNTLSGIEMVEKLCEVKALNLIDASTTDELKRILNLKTGLSL